MFLSFLRITIFSHPIKYKQVQETDPLVDLSSWSMHYIRGEKKKEIGKPTWQKKTKKKREKEEDKIKDKMVNREWGR